MAQKTHRCICHRPAKKTYRVVDPRFGLDLIEQACSRACLREWYFGTTTSVPRLPSGASIDEVS